MQASREEAQQLLNEVERTMQRTRHALAAAGAPYYLILWGLIWAIGFTVEQFASPLVTGWTWMVLDSIGGVLSFWIGYRQAQRVRSRSLGAHIGWFWLLLIVYGALWIWISAPQSERQFSLLITLYAMFGYVVMGLWLRVRGQVWLGLGVSGLAVLAYLLIPQVFYLTMGLLGGGLLILSGWWVLTRWRE